MSYRSLGSDEVTLRNYRPVGRRKGNMSLSDPLAAGVSLTFINPALGGIGIRLQAADSAKLDFFATTLRRLHRGGNIALVRTCNAGPSAMPKKQFLTEYSFRPELIAAMRAAFLKACEAPQVRDAGHGMTELVAEKILELDLVGGNYAPSHRSTPARPDTPRNWQRVLQRR